MVILQGQSQRFITQRCPRENLVSRRSMIHFGAHVQQQLRQLQITVLGGQMQSTIPTIVDRINVSSANEQQTDGIHMFLPDRIVQGS